MSLHSQWRFPGNAAYDHAQQALQRCGIVSVSVGAIHPCLTFQVCLTASYVAFMSVLCCLAVCVLVNLSLRLLLA